MKDNKRVLCTVCGERIALKEKRVTRYSYKTKGKNYEVYEYKCPYCSNIIKVSEKFLEDLN